MTMVIYVQKPLGYSFYKFVYNVVSTTEIEKS